MLLYEDYREELQALCNLLEINRRGGVINLLISFRIL